jgi:hypothetical protein
MLESKIEKMPGREIVDRAWRKAASYDVPAFLALLIDGHEGTEERKLVSLFVITEATCSNAQQDNRHVFDMSRLRATADVTRAGRLILCML